MSDDGRTPDRTDEDASRARAALADLRRLIESGRAMPMSQSCVISRPDALDLVETVTAGLPAQIRRADDVLARADAVVSGARRRADDIVHRAETEARKRTAEAERRAEQLVEHERVLTEARARADRVLAAARAEADRLARDADTYCDARLAAFAEDLERLHGQVDRGRKVIAERLARGSAVRADGTRTGTPTPPVEPAGGRA